MAEGNSFLSAVRMRETLDRLFPERQFYFRSDGVVRFFTLKKHTQIAAVGGVAVVFAWLTFTTAHLVFRNEIIDAKDDRIREISAAYEQLAQRSVDAERRFLSITGEVEAQHRQLLALVDYRARLEREIQEVRNALERTAGERDHARATLLDLQGRISTAETQLAAAVINAEALTRSLNEAQRSTQMLAAARDTALSENRSLLTAVTDLRRLLTGAMTAEERVNAALGEANSRLAESERQRDAARTRGTDLERQIAELTTRNVNTSGQANQLLQNLGQAETQTARLSTERDEALQSRDFMAKLVDELQLRLTNLKDSQIDLVTRLKDRADANVALAENVIRQTGLDMDRLLSNAPNVVGGIAMGGPYIPLAYNGQTLGDSRDPFFQTVIAVEQQMERWGAMEQLLAALPLAAPTDNFSLSSGFGTRIDPFTKTKAFHEGLDFVGPLNSPIKSPAPGVVTRVGYWGSYGLMVEIDHGFGITTRYGHLAKATVKKGQMVEFQQGLGTMGRSGRTTGPHLHYEVLFDGDPLDPANFLKAGRNVFKNGD